MDNKISIVMPVYNDEKNIKNNILRLLKEVRELGYDPQLIVVDDGSTDATNDIMVTMYPMGEFDSVSYGKNKGKGHAFLEGLRLAQCKHVLLIDSDLQVDIKELPMFFNVMKVYFADAVVGNKRHAYSHINYTFTRRLISNVYNYICRVCFGVELRDTQCGFKLFKTKTIRKVQNKIKTKRFAFDLELIIALRENRYRIADAPVYINQQYNAGSISLRNIWDTLKDTVLIWIRKKEGYYGNA